MYMEHTEDLTVALSKHKYTIRLAPSNMSNLSSFSKSTHGSAMLHG